MRRVAELDALRGLAALAIVIYHFRPRAFFFGWAAVDLFFVLSGYLITGIVLRHQGTPRFFLAFYARRFLRIWPIYYITLLALVAVTPLGSGPTQLDALPYYLTFTQNIQHYWFGALPPFSPKFAHTWTLAIEEQFYLAWPFLILLAGRRQVIPLCVGLAALAVIGRALGFDWWILLTRCDGFVLGGMLAALPKFEHSPARRSLAYTAMFGAAISLGLAELGLGVLVHGGRSFLMPPEGPKWPGLTILAINLVFFGVVGLAITHSGTRSLAVLRSKSLAYLGQVSYGLYLYHPLVFWLADRCAARMCLGPSRWLDAAKLLGGLAAASASWHFIERPILKLKDRFPYRGEPPRDPVPAPSAPAERLRGAVAGR